MTYRKLFLLFLLCLLALPARTEAQGFNGRARTYMSALQIRDLVLDSLPEDVVPGEGVQRTLPDGTTLTCGDAYCRYYRSGRDRGVIPVIQDLQVNVWTGITGLRVYAHVRARESIGDWDVIWPRMEEPVEALSAWVEYRRSFYRIKAGRIWQTSSLGYYNYDGASGSFRLPFRLDLEVYGGLSLVRGLNQLHNTDLISSVEPLAPREDAYLGGFEARWRPYPALATSFTYQREETIHSGDLYSERIAGSARFLFKGATLTGEVKYDLATEEVNLAKLQVRAPLGMGFRGSTELRTYTPFFPLWTIWGAFSPVGYDEARARLDWMHAGGSMAAYVYGGYRQYGDTSADAPAEYGIRDDGWRIALGGRYDLTESLTTSGEYRYDEGYGATRHGGDLSVRRSIRRDLYVVVKGTAFETFSELQIGSGRVYGAGLEGAAPLGPAKIRAGAMFYKHDPQDQGPGMLDLNQARLNLSVEIPFGQDPGLSERGNQ